MKGFITILSFVVSGALIWWTLESDLNHAQEEQAKTQAYMRILEPALKTHRTKIIQAVPAQTRVSAFSKYIDKESVTALQDLKRYSADLDAFFTHHMQVIYLKHDGKRIKLIAADKTILMVAE